MTTAEEIDKVIAKCEAAQKRLPAITVEMTETEVAYLLLGLGQLVIPRPVFKAGDPLQELKIKLLSALRKAKENG